MTHCNLHGVNIVTEEDFPGGLRCESCRREIEPGEEYAEILTGFVDHIPMTYLICLSCEDEKIDRSC